MEMGKSRSKRPSTAQKEVGLHDSSMTLSLAAVFLPVFFMAGVFGRLLHEFAVVIISAVLVSGLVSLTLTPMICSRYLRPEHGKQHGWLYRKLEGVLEVVALVWRQLALVVAASVLVMLLGLAESGGHRLGVLGCSRKVSCRRKISPKFGFHAKRPREFLSMP